jgi:hypothetical protein
MPGRNRIDKPLKTSALRQVGLAGTDKFEIPAGESYSNNLDEVAE